MITFSLPAEALAVLDNLKPTLRRDPRLVRDVKARHRALRLASFDRSLRASRSGRGKWKPNAI